MATTIGKFQDAYATLTVAVYEPLILRWVSGWSILTAANTMAWRGQKSKHISLDKAIATAHALGPKPLLSKLPDHLKINVDIERPDMEFEGRSLDGKGYASNVVQPIDIDGFPDAVAYNGNIYPNGLDNVTFKSADVAEKTNHGMFSFLLGWGAKYKMVQKTAKASVIATSTPVIKSKRMGIVEKDFDFVSYRDQLYKKMVDAAKSGVQESGNLHVAFSQAFADINGIKIFDFLPALNIEEALSPIGIAHYYI